MKILKIDKTVAKALDQKTCIYIYDATLARLIVSLKI